MADYQLAQLNIAKFVKPSADPANQEFFDNIDQVNLAAEAHPGFVRRLVDEGSNDATSIQAFNDPDMIVNLSVWRDVASLRDFVYQNSLHRAVMRRRENWFAKMQFYLVLWWVPSGELPTLTEAKAKLSKLQAEGPTHNAFTFASLFAPPGHDLSSPD